MGPIAVFDSGVGGLSVLRELVAQMPSEHFLYFGDSANAPYGTRPTAEIRSLTLAHAERLFDRGAKALVVACNTATSAAIGALRARWPDRVIIGIEPALKLAVSRHPGGCIGVLATEATLREEKFAALLQRCAAHCASATDIEEAFQCGKVAVESALRGETGKMVGMVCKRDGGYSVSYELFDLRRVANAEKKIPLEWITSDNAYVTDAFIDYCTPLLEGQTALGYEDGLPRFARLKKVFAK